MAREQILYKTALKLVQSEAVSDLF